MNDFAAADGFFHCYHPTRGEKRFPTDAFYLPYAKHLVVTLGPCTIPYKQENIMALGIPQEFESFVASLVARRRFLSEQEVLLEGLRLLRAKESLAEEIQRGFEQIDEGHGVDGPRSFAKLRARLAERIES
jgi:antitoxin ParD1/3/4